MARSLGTTKPHFSKKMPRGHQAIRHQSLKRRTVDEWPQEIIDYLKDLISNPETSDGMRPTAGR
jgi:hypothetical protein